MLVVVALGTVVTIVRLNKAWAVAVNWTEAYGCTTRQATLAVCGRVTCLTATDGLSAVFANWTSWIVETRNANTTTSTQFTIPSLDARLAVSGKRAYTCITSGGAWSMV